MVSEKAEMLKELGIQDVEALFSDLPKRIRIEGLDIEKGQRELEVRRRVKEILSKNRTVEEMPCFLGAGVYNHYIPSAIPELLSRSEFYSSYTPYQPEISQGMLQALFEYQSFVCELTGMDAANSSMYDASTALAEACLMSVRITRKKSILIPRSIFWEKKAVLMNYAKGPNLLIQEVPYEKETGRMDLSELERMINDDVAAVYLESPNFFGIFESITQAKNSVGDAILIVGANPLSLALVEAPGNLGADIVVGECQGLGSPMNFGGPLIGMFACKKEYIRKMPGRVIGATTDSTGRRAYCMALQTREQHIRREKATSNICTNESLGAVASAIHMAILGRSGLRKLAKENILRARELARRIDSIDGFSAPVFSGTHFNEFVIRSEKSYAGVDDLLLSKGIQGGLPLAGHFSELENCALYCTTEMHTKNDYDMLLKVLEECS
ncbi:MAG: aminomethyl-transferring glycine dehydrogenase subunit GcvPA [Thermoplasmata archaeon]